jgi:hypothetical protein
VRQVVLVSGVPGAGKSTVAGPLAAGRAAGVRPGDWRPGGGRSIAAARRLHPIPAQGAGATLGPEAFARSGRPVGIGAVLTADTAGPVDVPALAAAVRALLP